MWTGHYGPAFIGKLLAPNVPLSTLFLAGALADLTFFMLAMIPLEKMNLDESIPGVFPYNNEYPFTHSLLGITLLGVLLASLYYRRQRSARDAGVILLTALSHWVLELPGHRKDVSLLPGLPPFYGAGLFNYRILTFILESLAVYPACYLYLKRTAPLPSQYSRSLMYERVMWGFLTLQNTIFCFAKIPIQDTRFGHPIVFASLIILSCVAAYRLDSTRTTKEVEYQMSKKFDESPSWTVPIEQPAFPRAK